MNRFERMSNAKVGAAPASAIVIALLCIVVAVLVLSGEGLPRKLDDFVVFWVPGRLLLGGEDPYDLAEIRRVLDNLGWPASRGILPMFNPPLIFTLSMPFALVPYDLARILWLASNAAAIVISVGLLSAVSGVEPRYRPRAILSAFLFTPTLFALSCGQVSPFVLLGLAGFLYCERTGRSFAAGMAVALLVIKPHIVCLFWPIVAVWSIRYRQRRFVLGLATAVLVGLLVPVLQRPELGVEYWHFITTSPPAQWATPTWGTVLRLIGGEGSFWLQFVPMILGCLWCVWILLRNVTGWSWERHLPLIVLVSLVCMPYGWDYDMTIAIVAIVPVICRERLGCRWCLCSWCLASLGGISLLVMPVNILNLPAWWQVWIGPCLLGWYLAWAVPGRHSPTRQTVRNQ